MTDLEQAICNLIERYGDTLPNPDNYPGIVKAMVRNEMFNIQYSREYPKDSQ